MSRVQLLASKFENMKMHDDESVADFNVQLLDIAKESFAPGEKSLKKN